MAITTSTPPNDQMGVTAHEMAHNPGTHVWTGPLHVDAHELAHNMPTHSWNAQAAQTGFRPIPLDGASLAAYAALFAKTPVSYMDRVNAALGTPATQDEAADAVVRVRLSGSRAGITPAAAMTEADMASRALYAGTGMMQATHPDPLNVATRVAVLRGEASPMQEPSPLEIDLKSIMQALEIRDAAPASTSRKVSALKGTSPS